MSKATPFNGLRNAVAALMRLLDGKADKDKVVSSVNGTGPDAEGNVQVQVGVTSWNDLSDRPFYEETGRGVLYEKTVIADDAGEYFEENTAFAFVEGERYEVVLSIGDGGGNDVTIDFVASADEDGASATLVMSLRS